MIFERSQDRAVREMAEQQNREMKETREKEEAVIKEAEDLIRDFSRNFDASESGGAVAYAEVTNGADPNSEAYTPVFDNLSTRVNSFLGKAIDADMSSDKIFDVLSKVKKGLIDQNPASLAVKTGAEEVLDDLIARYSSES